MRIIVSLAGVEELCACQMTEMLGLSPAAVSRHLSVLLNANLVRSRKESRWVYYRLSDDFPPLAKQWLMESLSSSREAADDRKRLENVLSCAVEAECKPRVIRKMGQGGLTEERGFSREVEPDALTRQVAHWQDTLLLVRAPHSKTGAREMAR
ncbi:MAG: metalloregulator ArsR/SmtB family transcription factor [Dehalococcoidia bacterium]|nr:metalloregulator ArsR/SmtB family transcription factor [Dehalococcoidia bacterium]